jgi:hypothetical protein
MTTQDNQQHFKNPDRKLEHRFNTKKKGFKGWNPVK